MNIFLNISDQFIEKLLAIKDSIKNKFGLFEYLRIECFDVDWESMIDLRKEIYSEKLSNKTSRQLFSKVKSKFQFSGA